jgi:hypothetical protein
MVIGTPPKGGFGKGPYKETRIWAPGHPLSNPSSQPRTFQAPPNSDTPAVLNPHCPGCPLLPSEEEGSGTVGDKLT